MSRILNSIFMIGALFSSTAILAGGMISSGGEIFGSAINPWFLDVPEQGQVKYCIMIDHEYFHLQSEDAASVIKGVIKYWDEDFSTAFLPTNQYGTWTKKIRVKTKDYNLIDCDPALENFGVDIVFQFGYLTEKQKEDFKKDNVDLTKYVAVSIRTSYDESNLRGRGFVYVSPDSGPLKFMGDNVIDDVWSAEGGQLRLTYVLNHEFGHILGLRHINSKQSLMNEGYPEAVVSKNSYLSFIRPGQSFFYPKEGQVVRICRDNIPEKIMKFFGIPLNNKCLEIYYQKEKLLVKSREDFDTSTIALRAGSVIFPDREDVRIIDAVNIWLPSHKTVLGDVPSNIRFLKGPAINEVQKSGLYITTDGTMTRKIFIQTGPSFFQIGGEMDGTIIPDILSELGEQNPSGWMMSEKKKI